MRSFSRERQGYEAVEVLNHMLSWLIESVSNNQADGWNCDNSIKCSACRWV